VSEAITSGRASATELTSRQPGRGGTARLRSPDQLARLLDIPFTAEQLAAITAPLEPGVIVAGAGSGKTTVMAARVVWLVGTGAVPPERVLGLTFTNKAAGELTSRVRAALARAGVSGGGSPHEPVGGPDAVGREPGGEPTVSTYHAFAGRLIREHGLRIGVEPSSRLLADATRYQLAANVIRRAPGPFTGLTGALGTLVGDLIALDAELSEHLVEPAALRAHDKALLARIAALPKPHRPVVEAAEAATARLELTGLIESYRATKRARDLIDFGDQVALAARLAELPAVAAIERERYAVVLLDEYQDTSVAQRRLLAALFRAHPVTAVGDPCQAIYGWRGASVANLDEFPEHFRCADGTSGRRYTLSENRRSGGRLLEFANKLAEPLRERHAGVTPLRPRAGAAELGAARCALLPDQDAELAWVGDRVRELVDAGTPPAQIAVLVRAAADFPSLHAALVARDVPVEVVGLSGLLHLPEVADVVATLEVVDEPTANAALVRLLAGPRWRIGPRDLALLGQRARELVGAPDRRARAADPDAHLRSQVENADPSEVVSLSDALGDLGTELGFSTAAARRFARLATEIRTLRRGLGEPLLDLLHRVVTVTGLDVELAASPHALAARRRDSLAAFLEVAADFTDLDGDGSLTAFLAFLRAAARHDRGLDTATPTGGAAVTLMTAHKAKGLEWDVVVVPGLSVSVFPSGQPRERWTSKAAVLPFPLRGDAASLPSVGEWDNKGLLRFKDEMAEHAAVEELRLGYVAFTRPRHLLLASGHWWGPTQKRPRGPSAFLEAVRAHCAAGGGQVDAWADPPGPDAVNPLLDKVRELSWPAPLDPAALAARRRGAALVDAALAELDATDEASAPSEAADAGLTVAERGLLAAWDRDAEALLRELAQARTVKHEVVLPASLTATQLMLLHRDPDELARELARPMPRPPHRGARRGTMLHAWIESRFEQRPLLEPDDLPGARDAEIDDDAELAALREAFLRTEYARREPYRVEAPFQILLGARLVRGRIDAVFRDGEHYEVVDWKTGRDQDGDPVQLAIYRVAWAELAQVPLAQVGAAFVYIRTGEVVRPTGLPERDQLAALLRPEPDS
jgi:DNA helicase-2/ATP-dependent DNA helicase PcrA